MSTVLPYAVELIQEANRNEARLSRACEELHIHVQTYQRWVSQGDIKIDQRPHAPKTVPKNKLSEEEKSEILEELC